MAITPATRLGPYGIVGRIGTGGMGEVWKAKDTRLGREVAIKVLPETFAAHPERLRRFEQEARSVSSLNHPNILTLFDVGSHEGAPFLVMELLEGETLRQAMARGPVPLARVLEVAVQAAKGLGAAHGKGIVHRDLKPENLWITKDGRVKLLDFGLAKPLAPLGEGPQTGLPTQDFRNATVEGAILGTVGYMSPEQVRGEAVDARSDLFALGVLLHEMLGGTRPFQRDTAVQNHPTKRFWFPWDNPRSMFSTNSGSFRDCWPRTAVSAWWCGARTPRSWRRTTIAVGLSRRRPGRTHERPISDCCMNRGMKVS
jgi:eukaryotic-like serine/threonine-protein kinase